MIPPKRTQTVKEYQKNQNKKTHNENNNTICDHKNNVSEKCRKNHNIKIKLFTTEITLRINHKSPKGQQEGKT